MLSACFGDICPVGGAGDIIEFFKCLVSRVFVTVTYTRDISVAFQMFVSVNQGGTPLNAFDLFRGLIMTKAHVLGFQSMIRADVQDLTSAVRKSTGADGDGAESLINGVMRKWASARYGVVVKERDVPGRLDKEIRTIDDMGSLREIVRQACSFFLAFEQLNNISDILQEVKNKAGIWPYRTLQSRRVRGLAGQSFLKQQHSILLISMYSRRHLSGANPYSAEDIHSVMDYIEWLEFRLAIQPSNILEQFYPKIANTALNISKIATWWDQMVELGNDRHNSFQSGFAIFKEGPVKENVAVAFLSKIHDSNKDPGPSTRLYSCGAVQLAPITSPKPWKLRDDDIHKVTGYLGNWFLIDYRQKKTILSWGNEPESRWESLHEAAEKNATREELEAIKENKSGKGGTEHKPIEDYWSKSRIQKRTRRLINKLEGLPKPVQEKKNEFRAFSVSYRSKISKVQLEKSIINANKDFRQAVFPLVDYSLLKPGEKILIPCRIERESEIFETTASCYIPKRRGDTQPEPRIWPMKAAGFLKPGDMLDWRIVNDYLQITVVG